MYSLPDILDQTYCDSELDDLTIILTPLERLAAAQLDREARWEAMDNRTALESKRHYQWRQAHADELRERRRERHECNRDRENELSRQWYLAHCVDAEWYEQKKEMNRAYQALNGEQYAARKREAYWKDPERYRTQKRAWTAEHREEINARKRAVYWEKKARSMRNVSQKQIPTGAGGLRAQITISSGEETN